MTTEVTQLPSHFPISRRVLVVTAHGNACFYTQRVNLHRNVNIRNSDAEKWEPSYRKVPLIKGTHGRHLERVILRMFSSDLSSSFIISSHASTSFHPSYYIGQTIRHVASYTHTHMTPQNSPHCPSA